MNGYELHPETFADLDDIRAYIAEDNADAADYLITEIFDRVRALEKTAPLSKRRSVR